MIIYLFYATRAIEIIPNKKDNCAVYKVVHHFVSAAFAAASLLLFLHLDLVMHRPSGNKT